MRRTISYIIIGIALITTSMATALLIAANSNASTITLYPNQDPSGLTGNATTSWLATPAIAQYSILNRASYNESQYLCGSGGTWGFRYGMDDVVTVGQGAYSVTLNASPKMRRSSIFTTPDDKFAMAAYILNTTPAPAGFQYWSPGWSDTSGSTCSLTFNVGTEYPVSFTYDNPSGNWTTAAINSLEMYMGRQTVGSADTMKLYKASATVSYDADPKVISYATRIFQDSNTTTPGPVISPSYFEPGQLTARGQKFRLRMLTYNTTGDAWRVGYAGVKLQYAKKTVADCKTQSGWGDVTSSSAGLRFYDNPNITNGAALSYASDPDISSTPAQQYRESNNAVIVSGLTAADPLTGWDFSLQESPDVYGGSYCVRVLAVSPAIEDISYYSPGEVILHPEPLGVDVVDSTGNGVASPQTSFGNLTASTQCQQSNAVFGDVNQKIRLKNGTATNGWSVSVAPTGGAAALWSSGGGDQYDFNDSSGTSAGCVDSGDADNKAGQLTVKPAASVLAASPGCSNTGVIKGSNAAYVQGTVDAITLLSASSAAPLYCAWDLTSVGLTQTIPPLTPTGTYKLDLTMTAVAS